MRTLCLCLCHTWRKTFPGSEHLLMDCSFLYTQRDKIPVHIPEKRRWPTHVKIGFNRNAEFLEACQIPVPSNVEVVTKLVSWVWLAVCNCRMTASNAGEQLPGLLSKDMFLSVARRIDPPNFL